MEQSKILILVTIALGAYVLMKKTGAQVPLATSYQPVPPTTAYQTYSNNPNAVLAAGPVTSTTGGLIGGLLSSMFSPGTNKTPGISLATAQPSYTPDSAGEAAAAAAAAASVVNNLDSYAVNPVSVPAYF